MLSIVKRR